MAGEQRLRDAKIEVRVDTEAARRALDDLESGRDRGRSRPGERPPSPGRKDERREREREDRERRGRKPGRFGTAVAAGAAARRGPSAVLGAVQTIVAAALLRNTLDVVPGMIDKRLDSMGSGLTDQMKRIALEAIDATIGDAFRLLSGGVTALESGVHVSVASGSAAINLARSIKLLTGQTPGGAALGRVAFQAGAIKSAEVGLGAERRRLGREAFGAMTVDAADMAKQKIIDSINTNK